MLYIDRDKCIYCGGCVGICPKNALELRETVLFIYEDLCINCNSCIKFCPAGALYNRE
ncbi:MAG: ferredoxin [Candidatus Altiarchaeales archaeon]|nr:MAG: ferredoxin [Candidatus Altiarchaeales archaeon]